MAKYLFHGNYVGAGVTGLAKEGGSNRRKTVEKMIKSLGGKIESFYYAFGGTDVFVIVDLPDNVSAAAASLVVNASGSVNLRTTVLMTPQEMDQAAKKGPKYQAPGA